MTACAPTGSELTVRLAEPDDSADVPRDVLPVENVMLPVGVPAPEPGTTLAVNATGLPNAGAVGENDNVVVVPIGAGGVFVLELPFPPQPIAKKAVLNAIKISTRKARRRRLGNPSITRPARLAIALVPNHPVRDLPDVATVLFLL